MIWLELLVDRIHINIPLPEWYYSLCIGQLWEMTNIAKDLLPSGKIKVWKEGYATYLHYCPSKKPIAEIIVGSTKTQHRYLSLCLFPSQFRGNEFSVFKEQWDLFSPDLSYASLFEKGRVAYIEVALDSLSLARENLIPFRAYSRISDVYLENDTGHRGAVTLGSEKSRERICVYDKKRKFQEEGKEKDTPYSNFKYRTRIESKSRHIGLSPSKVGLKMKNRFSKLEIADLQMAYQLFKDQDWHVFLKLCEIDGSASALKQNAAKKSEYLARLRQCAVPNCRPADHWKKLPQAMQVIAP